MSVDTVIKKQIPEVLLEKYFSNLVNRFFKILPMRENHEETTGIYIRSLQAELLGCGSLIPEIYKNSLYLSLLSILQYLADHPECPITDVKREIFGAISICNKLMTTYADKEEV